MVSLNVNEKTQYELLKKEIANCPSGVVVYPRDLLKKHNQAPNARVIRRLVEEINAGVEKTIKLQFPKADVWKVYRI